MTEPSFAKRGAVSAEAALFYDLPAAAMYRIIE